MSTDYLRLKEALRSLEESLDDIESSRDVTGVHNGDLPHQVIHLSDNPFSMEVEKEELEFQRLSKENEELKARLSFLESGCDANVTILIDEAVKNAQRIKQLEQVIADYKSREDKITSSLSKTAVEFREACYCLIGYRVDALKDNIYRLTHRFSAQQEDKLLFQVKRDGSIVVMKNDYAKRYNRYINLYIEEGDSIPAFLAAITLDLFDSQWQSVDMSVSMSDTVLPANATRTSFVVDRRHFPNIR